MNEHPSSPPQNEESWEVRVQENARNFAYPPTPDISIRTPARPVIYRRLAQVAVAILLVFLALMAVPEIRAGVLEFLRIGAVRIFLVEPTPTLTPTPMPSGTPRPTEQSGRTTLDSVLDLPGETTLADAQAQMRFTIKLPPSLGEPDKVFVVWGEMRMVVLVWLDPAQPDRILTSLHEMDSRGFGGKYYPWEPTATKVNDNQALWLTQPHTYEFYEINDEQVLRHVEANVLLWEADRVTYRLETTLTMDEAVALAESME